MAGFRANLQKWRKIALRPALAAAVNGIILNNPVCRLSTIVLGVFVGLAPSQAGALRHCVAAFHPCVWSSALSGGALPRFRALESTIPAFIAPDEEESDKAPLRASLPPHEAVKT